MDENLQNFFEENNYLGSCLDADFSDENSVEKVRVALKSYLDNWRAYCSVKVVGEIQEFERPYWQTFLFLKTVISHDFGSDAQLSVLESLDIVKASYINKTYLNNLRSSRPRNTERIPEKQLLKFPCSIPQICKEIQGSREIWSIKIVSFCENRTISNIPEESVTPSFSNLEDLKSEVMRRSKNMPREENVKVWLSLFGSPVIEVNREEST